MTLRRLLSIALATVALGLAGCGDDEEGFTYQDDGQLQVMTRNLYLGADLTPVFTATTTPGFLAAAGGVLTAVRGPNEFTDRVGALADEIAAFRPDLVGLQEATLWRTQIPGDGPGAPGPGTPAPLVLYDFLSMLQAELLARGVPYNVAVERAFFDVEVLVSGIPGQPPTDVRITDRQAILAIAGLPTSAPDADVFSDLFAIPLGGVLLPVQRGWTKVNATVGGQQIAFYNTHLEAFDPTSATSQAIELRGIVDAEFAATGASPQVLLGDLNSDPLIAPIAGGYNTFVFTGVADFDDLVTGLTSITATCCLGGPGLGIPDGILTNPDSALETRIDHILSRGAAGRLTPVSADRIGEEAADFAKAGRWPSDHAGVVGTFRP
jgi:endonuclease/exonuclease/phosphatase family metal-dependent hydrolase